MSPRAITELFRLVVATVKQRRDKRRGQIREDWKSRTVGWISSSGIALIKKGSVARTACENLSGVGLRLYVKVEVDGCKHMSVTSRLDTHTDGHTV